MSEDTDTTRNAEGLLGGSILVGVHPDDRVKTVANTATRCGLLVIIQQGKTNSVVRYL